MSLIDAQGASVPLSDEQAQVHALRTQLRHVPRNSSILRAGEPGVRVRTLTSGWAFRCRTFSDGRRQILDIMLPGDTFGIETLFGGPADYLVWAATAVTYAVLDGDATVALFDEAPWFRRRLMRVLGNTISAIQNWTTQLGQCTAEERTAALLLLLHRRLEARGMASGHRFKLELTQLEQADTLGLHIVHLNRVLARLRARRFIAVSGAEVTLLDFEGLTDLAPAPAQVLHHDDPL